MSLIKITFNLLTLSVQLSVKGTIPSKTLEDKVCEMLYRKDSSLKFNEIGENVNIFLLGGANINLYQNI